MIGLKLKALVFPATSPSKGNTLAPRLTEGAAFHGPKAKYRDHLLPALQLAAEGRLDRAGAALYLCSRARLPTLVPDDTGGVFEVKLDGKLVWSRKDHGRFPEMKELKQLVRDEVAPERDLGHVDTKGPKP